MPNKRPNRKKSSLKISSKQDLSLFKTLFNYIGDDLLLIDEDGRIAYINDAGVKSYGYTRDYLLSRRITEFMHPKITVKQFKARFFGSSSTKKRSQKYLVERRIKGGDTRKIDVTSVYVLLDNKRYILAVGRDVTEQFKMQEKLKESETVYRRLCDEAADGIFTADLAGRITYANKACEKLVNKPRSSIVGSHFREYPTKRSLPTALKMFYDGRRGKSGIGEELEIITSDGDVVPVDVRVTPLFENKKVKYLQAIVRDISRRKQLTQIKHEADLWQSLNHFTSGVARELRYPLKGISQRLERIIKEYAERDYEYVGFKEYKQIMETLESVADQAQYCHATINRLYNLDKRKPSRGDEGCDVNAVLKSTVSLLDEQFLSSKVSISLRLGKNLPLVSINQMDLGQITINLLTNSIQAMPAAGIVTMQTAYHRTKNCVNVKIKDEGIGIKRENLTKIFHPFFTTKQRGLEKSSGLGLSIVYSIVKANKGNISVKSSLRKGTVVTIELPIRKGAKRK